MKLYMLKKILENNGEWQNKKSENVRVLHIKSREVNIQLKNNDETPFLDILAEDIGYEEGDYYRLGLTRTISQSSH